MKFLVIIPSRYGSSRFPGKPLAKLGGLEIILRVCNQVEKSEIPFIVATDNDKIAALVQSNGYKVVMTGSHHQSGTDRVAEAYELSDFDADVIINVQGDEPFVSPDLIQQLCEVFKNEKDVDIATLISPFNGNFNELQNPNLVKVVISDSNRALYFSRSVVPFLRNVKEDQWPLHHQFYTHIGIYAFRTDILKNIVRLKKSSLEEAECLEQLRWLQNGYIIKTVVSDYQSIGIDTPEDLIKAEKYLKDKDI